MQPFEAHKNLPRDKLTELIEASDQKAVRRIKDPETGDLWYWRAELATHAQGAEKLGIHYDKRPGEGEILTF